VHFRAKRRYSPYELTRIVLAGAGGHDAQVTQGSSPMQISVDKVQARVSDLDALPSSQSMDRLLDMQALIMRS
jgi:hypothetical protein